MGCFCGKAEFRQYDRDDADDADDAEEKATILLLGTSGSGKSTIAKQMRIINLDGYSKEEKMSFLPILKENARECMLSILDGMLRSGMELPSINENMSLERFREMLNEQRDCCKSSSEPHLIIDLLDKAYSMPSIQDHLEAHQHEIHLAEVGRHIGYRLKDMMTSEYEISDEDILRCRLTTTGIQMTEFKYKGTAFKMVDVGGQRSERRKWIHCFDDVTTIIFCVSLIEYNEVKPEEDKASIEESLQVFESIINSVWFKNKDIILFLNKVDLFREKIKMYPLSEVFNDFSQDESSYEKSIEFIKGKFLNLDKQTSRTLWVYETCATNTKNIETVTSVLFNNILDQLAMDIGIQ